MAKKRTSIFKKPDLSDNLEAIERLKKKRHWDGDTIGRLLTTKKLTIWAFPYETEPKDDENKTYSTRLNNSIPDDLLDRRIKLLNNDELKVVQSYNNLYTIFHTEGDAGAERSIQGVGNVNALMWLLDPVRVTETDASYINGTPKAIKDLHKDLFIPAIFDIDNPLDIDSLNNLSETYMIIIDDCVYIEGYNSLVDIMKDAKQIPLFERFKYIGKYLPNVLNQYNELIKKTEQAIINNIKNDDLTKQFKLDIIHTIFKPIDMKKCNLTIGNEKEIFEESKSIVFSSFDEESINDSLDFFRKFCFIKRCNTHRDLYNGAERLTEKVKIIWQNYKNQKA